MQKIKLFSFLFLSFYMGYGQVNKKISVELGIAFRGAAIVLADKPFVRNPYGFSYSSTKLFRNKSFAIDIKKNIFSKRYFLELSSYFRYGHFHDERDQATGTTKELKRFKHDHFLDLLYEFGKQKPGHIIFTLGAGYGYMNIGTGFTYNMYWGNDAAGNPIVTPVKGTFQFAAPRLIVGLRRNRLQGFIIVHGTPDEEFESNPTLCIETKFTYSFFRINLKTKNK